MPTYGGYSEQIVVREAFVLASRWTRPARGGAAALRRDHDLLAATALEGGQGTQVGVIGLGGLGHMAVKLATALGAR